MKMRYRPLLAIGVACAALASGAWVAQSAVAAGSAQEEQPSLVEDYAYPDAAAIQASTGVTLLSGDGHIVYADCNTPPDGNIGLVQVWTTAKVGADQKGLVCFKVLGPKGHLNLKVPAVFEIDGDGRTPSAGHKMKAELTTDAGQHTTVDVSPYGSTPVGVGTKGAPTTLLQLDVTP
ncbi:hypothetical protein [Amycolatopsis sp. NPDC058986]|uniref:hypothetical protein n=1 Tax=unclassified Amycolatopsis TaxID=2618356 RepID=UPI003670FD15